VAVATKRQSSCKRARGVASAPSAKEKAAVGRGDVVVGSVQRWLGNPVSKTLLRFVCGRSKCGGNRLDIALRRYGGEDVERAAERMAELGLP